VSHPVPPGVRVVGARLSPDLLTAAAQALGMAEDAPDTAVVRGALAAVAGLDVAEYAALRKSGPMPREAAAA
jgi:hypothetical protein